MMMPLWYLPVALHGVMVLVVRCASETGVRYDICYTFQRLLQFIMVWHVYLHIYTHIIIYSNYKLWYIDVDHIYDFNSTNGLDRPCVIAKSFQPGGAMQCCGYGFVLALRATLPRGDVTRWLEAEWGAKSLPNVYLTHPTRKTEGNRCNSGCYLRWMEQQTPAI